MAGGALPRGVGGEFVVVGAVGSLGGCGLGCGVICGDACVVNVKRINGTLDVLLQVVCCLLLLYGRKVGGRRH